MDQKEVQQHFIQVCAAYGTLRIADAINILKPICTKYEVELPEGTRFKEFVEHINEDLVHYDHDIVFVKYPINKEEYVVFRTVNSKTKRFLNHLSEQDCNYFRFLLMNIAIAENYGIREIRAINLTSQMPGKPLAKNRAETLLQTWKQVGYFVESNEILYFGPKTMAEFKSYLLKCFPDDIKECSLCKKIVLWDPSCKDCETKFHSECIRAYLIKASNCPACQKIWNTPFAS